MWHKLFIHKVHRKSQTSSSTPKAKLNLPIKWMEAAVFRVVSDLMWSLLSGRISAQAWINPARRWDCLTCPACVRLTAPATSMRIQGYLLPSPSPMSSDTGVFTFTHLEMHLSKVTYSAFIYHHYISFFSFGIPHDGQGNDCELVGKQPFIMSRQLHYDSSPLTWSSCSKEYITRFLEWEQKHFTCGVYLKQARLWHSFLSSQSWLGLLSGRSPV